MPEFEIDSEWTLSDTADLAKTYKLEARDNVYVISVGGMYVKVRVTGAAPKRPDPILVEADEAPFRQLATRPSRRG